MEKPDFIRSIIRSNYFQQKLSELEGAGSAKFSGLVGSSKSITLTCLADSLKNLFIITSTSREAEKLKQEVEFLSGKEVLIFPALDILPEEAIKPDKEIIGQRLSILNRLGEEKGLIVIAPLKAVMFMTLSKKKVKEQKLKIKLGEKLDLTEFIEKLVVLGYKRFDIVGERGEFSIRGGIVDIFPLNQERPVRLELVGDQIESLRSFDPYNQRSIEKIDAVTILSAAETFETPIFEYLEDNTRLVLDEILELSRIADELKDESPLYLDFEPVKERARIELSYFLAEGRKKPLP